MAKRKKFRVTSFGRDRLGNITGFRVVCPNKEGRDEMTRQFVGNIFKEGSFKRAQSQARKAADRLNLADQV